MTWQDDLAIIHSKEIQMLLQTSQIEKAVSASLDLKEFIDITEPIIKLNKEKQS